MRFVKAITIAALIATSATAAYAGPLNPEFSLQSLSNARYATVLPVTAGEARSLEVSIDTSSLQQRIKSNPALVRAVQDQGYSVDQIVGLENGGSGASVTFYAL